MHRELFRQHTRPIAPVPTESRAELKALPGIRAVLFDLYGTLIVSDERESAHPLALRDALASLGCSTTFDAEVGVGIFRATIRSEHEQMRRRGIQYPEVQIDEIWRRTVARLCERDLLPKSALEIDARRLAVEYEVRANRVWLMPHVRETLRALDRKGIALGIVSNAQFYIHDLLAALFGASPSEMGFDTALQFYSYRSGHAKPGTALYVEAARALKTRSIEAAQTLHVGNDVRNDVWPASSVGFRTALFAGDARSLRCRRGYPEVENVEPDLTIKNLPSLLECLL